MGADTALGVYNVSLQNHHTTVATLPAVVHKEGSKMQNLKVFSFVPVSQNFLGITDVLYLKNYEELSNLVVTKTKTVLLTYNDFFGKPDSQNFPRKNNGGGQCVLTRKCFSRTPATNWRLCKLCQRARTKTKKLAESKLIKLRKQVFVPKSNQN